MQELASVFLRDLILLYAVIDPIGSIPAFVMGTRGSPVAIQQQVALRAILLTSGLLCFCVLIAQTLLPFLGVPLFAWQVGGGLIITVTGLRRLLTQGKPSQDLPLVREGVEPTLIPLTLPSLASPATLSAVFVLQLQHASTPRYQAAATLIALVVMGLSTSALFLGFRVYRAFGHAGLVQLSRLHSAAAILLGIPLLLDGFRGVLGLS